MSSFIKKLSFGFICFFLMVSCSNKETDCTKNEQLLQEQLRIKDIRIAGLEDSLQKQMNPSGLSNVATNSGTTIASEAITTEASSYQDDKSNKHKAKVVRDKHYPGEFPEGSSKELTNRNLKFLSQWGLKVMLNEIYARHGMVFADGDIKNHFRRQDWYKAGTKDNVDNLLSDREKRNVILIKNYKFTPQIPV